MDSTDDGLLARRAQAGDREALASLVRRHHRLVVALCRRVVGPDQAEDAAQEAALLAMLQLDRLREPERFGAWVAGIALNVCRSWLRARRRGLDAWLGTEVADGQPDPAERAAAAELGRRVRQAVELLPAGQRAAVQLHYLTGLSQAEAASALGVRPGALRVRLHDARRALAAPLGPLWAAETGAPTTAKEETMTTQPQTELVEVRVQGVRLNPRSGNPAVDLMEQAGGRVFLVRVAAADAEALAAHLAGRGAARPLTHDFAASLVGAAGARVSRVAIERLADEILYATVTLEGSSGPTSIDARPADALNLAVRAGAPVFVRTELLSRFGATPEELARQEAEADAAARVASGPLTPAAADVLARLRDDVPHRFNHGYVGTEHLLLALAEDAGAAGRALRAAGIAKEDVGDTLVQIVGRGPEPYAGEPGYTPRMRRLLKLAGDEARDLGHPAVGTADLLLGLLREGEGLAVGILVDLGADPDKLREATLAELARGDG